MRGHKQETGKWTDEIQVSAPQGLLLTQIWIGFYCSRFTEVPPSPVSIHFHSQIPWMPCSSPGVLVNNGEWQWAY